MKRHRYWISVSKLMKICCYAFAGTALFFRALIEQCTQAGDEVEWSVIFPQGPFRHSFDDLIPTERRLYLYEDFGRVYHEKRPPFAWQTSPDIESIYLTLAKDKDGYRRLDKDEQLRRAATMMAVYRAFLERMRPDYVLAPDIEAVDGYILVNLCAELDIPFLHYTELRMLGRSFFSPDVYNTLPPYFGSYTEADLAEARAIIAAFRAGRPLRWAQHKHPPSAPPKPPLLRRVVTNTWLRWRQERLHASIETFGMRIRINFMPLVTSWRRRYFAWTAAHYFDIKPGDALPPRYILYMLHVTPESSINAFSPYFVDQFRAIDLILQNMPGDGVLVVKEHPSSMAMRPDGYYASLRRRPGLVLAHPEIPSRHLIENAAAIVSVTGTVGLECYFLDKPCLLLAPVFFGHLCRRLDSLDKLREQLIEMIHSYHPPSAEEKAIAIAKLINIGGEFIINDPWFVPSVCAPSNVAATRDFMWKHLRRLKEVPTHRGLAARG